MKTQIKCNSRIEILSIINKLEKHNISYIENEQGLLADVTPENAWCLGLI